jgi:hypothetical protein
MLPQDEEMAMRFARLLTPAVVALSTLSASLAREVPTRSTSDKCEKAVCAVGKKSADLQEMLESGLKARRPEEFAFIKRVVLLVEIRSLPEDLVRSTFQWARKKRPFPFPYFERGLKERAARLGINVQ